MDAFRDRRAAFLALHESGCFVIPNPWDAGSARFLQHLGFPALATTSAGFAFSAGFPDSDAHVPRDRVLANVAEIVASVDLPVSADFSSGYGATPDDVADSVRRCVATGVAGLSIEDATDTRDKPLFELSAAVDRIRAAREAIDQSGSDVLLTARAECYSVSHPDALNESIRRLQAYAEAGADVLFAPGLKSRDEISAVVAGVNPKPLNVLISRDIGLDVADLTVLGVRRISIGASLALAGWTGFVRAAQALRESGSFSCFDDLVPFSEINGVLSKGYTA